eukprot:1186904-Prorocentrum_minimum.AAC.1
MLNQCARGAEEVATEEKVEPEAANNEKSSFRLRTAPRSTHMHMWGSGPPTVLHLSFLNSYSVRNGVMMERRDRLCGDDLVHSCRPGDRPRDSLLLLNCSEKGGTGVLFGNMRYLSLGY